MTFETATDTLYLNAYQPRDLAIASRLLNDGQIVALPTETVYGLAARADMPAAVNAIYAAKGRPAHNPLIVHVAHIAQAQALAHWHAAAHALAQAFWPGPLTLLLPAREGCVAPQVLAGSSFIALRCPDNAPFLTVLQQCGGSLAAPSANTSGRVSPVCASHVQQDLSGKIAAIVDGGLCTQGLESTIVGFNASGKAYILREGPVTASQIAAHVPFAHTLLHDPKPSTPGQDLMHYAPRIPLIYGATPAHVQPTDGILAFGVPWKGGCALFQLSADENLSEAASLLFLGLHSLQQNRCVQRIVAMPIPMRDCGFAINDRLQRAACKR